MVTLFSLNTIVKLSGYVTAAASENYTSCYFLISKLPVLIFIMSVSDYSSLVLQVCPLLHFVGIHWRMESRGWLLHVVEVPKRVRFFGYEQGIREQGWRFVWFRCMTLRFFIIDVPPFLAHLRSSLGVLQFSPTAPHDHGLTVAFKILSRVFAFENGGK